MDKLISVRATFEMTSQVEPKSGTDTPSAVITAIKEVIDRINELPGGVRPLSMTIRVPSSLL